MTTTPDPRFDPRPLLDAAMDQVETLITSTDPSAASLPTPCSDFTVSGLIDHLQAVVRRIGVVLSGEPFWTVPHQVPSTDWVGDWRAGRAGTQAVLDDASNLDREVTVPWGTVPGASAAASYIGELAVHAWDLAVATDRVDQLDPTLAAAALPAYQEKVPADNRGEGIPFGPVVATSDDAPAYDRLVAWTGRDPHWTAPSNAPRDR